MLDKKYYEYSPVYETKPEEALVGNSSQQIVSEACRYSFPSTHDVRNEQKDCLSAAFHRKRNIEHDSVPLG